MADSDVSLKSIQLELESDSKGAEASIERLATSLLGLNSALKKVGNNAGYVRALMKSLATLDKLSKYKSRTFNFGINIKDFDESKVNAFSRSFEGLSKSLGAYKAVAKGGTGIPTLVNSLKSLSDPKLMTAFFVLPNVTEGIKTFFTQMSQMPQISENTLRMAEAYAKLGSNLKYVNAVQKNQLSEERNQIARDRNELYGIRNEIAQKRNELYEQRNQMMQERTNKAINTKSVEAAYRKFEQFASVLKTSFISGVNTLITAFKKLGSGISAVVGIVKKAISVFTQFGQVAFNALASTLGNAMSKGISGVKSFISHIQELKKQTLSVSSLTHSFKELLGVVVGIRGIYGVWNWAKEAVTAGANVAETNHIVESTFHDLTGEVNDWAKNAIDQYGIAENSAKRWAGTTSAMMQASGIGYKEAAKAATDLVGLAGDLSSFYNIDTETAYNKIRSGLAGMVRPLRKQNCACVQKCA